MKREYIILLGVLVLLAGSVGVFLGPVHAFGLINQEPTPTPYVAPQRGEEVPQSQHRAQATQAVEVSTTYNPWGIALDPLNGFVWVAEPGCDVPDCQQTPISMIGKFSMSDGSMLQEYTLPQGYSNPLFVAVTPDNTVWFTEPDTDAIGAFDSLTTLFTQYHVAKGSMPYDLIVDKNNNIWFTEHEGNNVGFLNTKTHTVVETPVPTPDSQPYGITMDAKGTIWFVENEKGVSKIGSFTPTTTGKITITEHSVDARQPHLITSDRQGNIWFSEAFAGSIGKFNPADGTTTNYKVIASCLSSTCQGTHISGIAIDQSGNVWFTDSLGGIIGYIVPASGQIVKKNFSNPNVHPHDGLAIDSNNTVWFTLEYGRQLGVWPRAKIPAK